MRPRRFGGQKVVRNAQLRLERLEDRNAPSDSLSSLSAPLSNWDVALDESDTRADSHPFHSDPSDRWQSIGVDSIALSGPESIQPPAPPISLSSISISTMTNGASHGLDLTNVSMPTGVDLGFGSDGSPIPMARRHVIMGLSPVQTRHAYGFDQLSGYDGSGRTIAIVDAYNARNIISDLQVFNTQFGLQQFNVSGGPTLKVVNQYGGSSLPSSNSGWALEIALDVEWAHAIAPKANILLVEASSASYYNLMAAVDYAAKNAQAVSMSWGSGKWGGGTSVDCTFKQSVR